MPTEPDIGFRGTEGQNIAGSTEHTLLYDHLSTLPGVHGVARRIQRAVSKQSHAQAVETIPGVLP
jgi:hypothetical protein